LDLIERKPMGDQPFPADQACGGERERTTYSLSALASGCDERDLLTVREAQVEGNGILVERQYQ
jgi:hypothetical protein